MINKKLYIFIISISVIIFICAIFSIIKLSSSGDKDSITENSVIKSNDNNYDTEIGHTTNVELEEKLATPLQEYNKDLYDLIVLFLKDYHSIDATNIKWSDTYTTNGLVDIYVVVYNGNVCRVGQRKSDGALCYLSDSDLYSESTEFVAVDDILNNSPSKDPTLSDHSYGTFEDDYIDLTNIVDKIAAVKENQVLAIINDIISDNGHSNGTITERMDYGDNNDYYNVRYTLICDDNYFYYIYFYSKKNFAFCDTI